VIKVCHPTSQSLHYQFIRAEKAFRLAPAHTGEAILYINGMLQPRDCANCLPAGAAGSQNCYDVWVGEAAAAAAAPNAICFRLNCSGA
jgi:hypothetical protein